MAVEDIDIDAAAGALLEAAIHATPGWIRGCVNRVATNQQLSKRDDLVEDAVERAVRLVETSLRELLYTDIDRQNSTPLSVFRDAVRFPVEVLHQLGAAPSERGDVARWAFPIDPFGLTPVNLSDIDDQLQHAGIVWGATKAALHLKRHGR